MILRRIAYFISGLSVVLLAVLFGLLVWEANTFSLEAKYLTRFASQMHFHLDAGVNPQMRFPVYGPFDQRFGYVALPEFAQRLMTKNFVVAQQARMSLAMRQMTDSGLNLPYHEKTQAGLRLLDEAGLSYYFHLTPQVNIPRFNAVPPVLRDSLLWIENHDLLDPPNQRNPAVEWNRLAQAIIDKSIKWVDPGHNVPGGSTLATQIEKFRHSRDGLTMTVQDKWQQMASASVRAYLDGSDTRLTRERVLLDYLNNVPLSAAPGSGEVVGLPDGLKAWYGLDWGEVSARLWANQPDEQTGMVYKHALSLLIAQRKPSYFLNANRDALENLTDAYLRLLARKGVITPALRDRALAVKLHFPGQPSQHNTSFVAQKAANATRTNLSSLLGMPSLYAVDQLDLTAQTSLNAAAQLRVSQFLLGLYDREKTMVAGMYGHDLLAPGDDLGHIMYSFSLYERTPQGAALRIQADSLNQPFDINRGAKLDLGSTAKLRTLITYLEIVSTLHDKFSAMNSVDLAAMRNENRDPISAWALDWYLASPDKSLMTMLQAAMARQYSANPNETFFTGGGLHHFVNFTKDENSRVMDLWEATRNSVNLVYIRLMRDIVRYEIANMPGVAGNILLDAHNPARRTYLERFADREGQAFMLRFYKKYRGQSPDQITSTVTGEVHPSARRLAALYRYLSPDQSLPRFDQFLHAHSLNQLDDARVASLYQQFAPGAFSLTDLGYIIQIHPLDLWLAGYLRHHPGATFRQAVAASRDQRIAVYNWLFQAGRKNAQDVRIHSLLEVEAFEQIHEQWKRLGYPFDSLVPSYATALGVSADRPDALAQLMGIIVNNGMSLPEVSIQRLHFAQGTPYETDFIYQAPASNRVLSPELTQVVRTALAGVVQSGTAGRLNGVYRDSAGHILPMGGKTGTGDHRFDTFDKKGNVLTSRVVDRTATFVFYIGDRYFGIMTAAVHGEAGADYHFTSALPAQLMKVMSPWLLSYFPPLLAPQVPKPEAGAPQVPKPETGAPQMPKPETGAPRIPELGIATPMAVSPPLTH